MNLLSYCLFDRNLLNCFYCYFSNSVSSINYQVTGCVPCFIDMEAAFDFKVFEPEQRKGGSTLDLSFWIYKVRARTTLQQYPRKDMEVMRRYSDFEWLRAQLSEENPFCIIPPIPEKAVQGTIDKIVGTGSNSKLLDYRQRALRKFLIRVGAHGHLHQSQLLQDFLEMDEAEWERRMKSGKKTSSERSIAAAIGEGMGSALSRQWYPTAAAQPSGASYTRALSEAKTSPQVWEETKAYVGQLEASINLLRDRLENLVKRRKDTSSALHEFGRSFSRVGEIEGSIEPTTLSNALSAVGQHSEHLSTVYMEQAESETKQVVETLAYYVGMCHAVREALKRLQGFIQTRDSLISQVQDLSSQRDKAIQKGGQPDKVQKIEQDLQQTTERRDAAIRHVVSNEELFKEELRRFHREKQYDIKAILKIFAELQLDYAAKMKRSWENLLPTVEQVQL